MAKSLRSATKKKTKAVKRTAVFKPVEDARLDRLATAQKAAAALPSVNAGEKTADDNAMEMDTPKVSTSGQRSNSKTRRKAKYGKKATKKRTNVF
ncbi:hypothetical protein BC940DRAFT_334947 [Gongronella butleri]|nr:hypothetical protein BC940DRAFT_334947 [Gongronella butleri]